MAPSPVSDDGAASFIEDSAPRWTTYMQRRVERREPGVPWHLEEKTELHRFAEDHGHRMAAVIAKFESIDEIDFGSAPDRFVLKPTADSSSRGVHLLSRQGEDQWFDALRRQKLTTTELNERLTAAASTAAGEAKQSYIIEEYLEDNDGREVPVDYKFYVIGGNTQLVLTINRNAKLSSVQWFDGSFRRVSNDQIRCNPTFVTAGDYCVSRRMDLLRDFAEAVAADIDTPFASIDLYDTTTGPMLGEVTLTPGGLYFGQHFRLARDVDFNLGYAWHQRDPITQDALLYFSSRYRIHLPKE